MVRQIAAIALVVMLAGCGGSVRAPSVAAAPQSSTQVPASHSRITVRSGEQTMIVDSPAVARRAVERMILESGGYIEHASNNRRGDVQVRGRIPAVQLDSVMNDVTSLGLERRRQLTGTDVTDQYLDLEARLRSTSALRDRLQQLLERAASLNEVVTLEKEIARLQTDIDALQARLDQLKGQVSLAVLSVDLERKRVLGPIAVAGRGVGRFFGKLF